MSSASTGLMNQSVLTRVSETHLLRRCVGRPFLRINEWVWKRLPSFVLTSRPIRRYGSFLHSLVKLRSDRSQRHGTFFFRNRPELNLIRDLVVERANRQPLKITVLACSNGAEVYSILWMIRSARPDLKVIMHAVDISNEVVEIGRNGVYSAEPTALVDSQIFARIRDDETKAMFDQKGDRLVIKPWLREGIHWQVGDAGDPKLEQAIGGRQDFIVANNFLCHMNPRFAERCLRNLPQLVKSDGLLLVGGVDLDIRTRVARELGWIPIEESRRDIHDGDPSVRRDWPLRYWGLEPFDERRQDWGIRYTSVFRLPSSGGFNT